MTEPRFLQIHFLAPYAATLLNRDDSGLAKRLPYGGSMRTRVSSQCLKRHWRKSEDIHSLTRISGFEEAYRSRSLIDEGIVKRCAGFVDVRVSSALAQWFNFAVYSGKGDDKPKKRDAKAKMDEKKGRPTLIFGEPELKWLEAEFLRLAEEAQGSPDRAFELGEAWVGLQKNGPSDFQKNRKANLAALREAAQIPSGLANALFGRMVTSVLISTQN